MINNNYYYYLKNNLDVLEYILIYSFVFIQNASNIYIYHSQNLNCKFYDNLTNNNIWKKSNIIFIKINNENLEDNLTKNLNENGGIYIKKPIFILRNIENFLDYDYIFLKDILVGVKNNNILKFEDIEDLNNNSKENIFSGFKS